MTEERPRAGREQGQPPPGPDERAPAGSGTAGPPGIRAVTAAMIIAAILAGFLHRLATGSRIPPWLVLLVSVLGLAAGAALLGRDAVRTGYEVVRGERR